MNRYIIEKLIRFFDIINILKVLELNIDNYLHIKKPKLFFVLSICIVSLLTASCHSTQKSLVKKEEKNVVVFPLPPDTARIQFLTAISGSDFVTKTKKQSAFSKYVIGEKKDIKKPIIKPYGLHMHGNKIYICDIDLGGLEIIDLAKQTFDYFLPRGEGRLLMPLNCAVDKKGYLIVTDKNNKRVVVFDETLNYHASLRKNIEYEPVGVAVYDHKIWVSDLVSNQIDVYDDNTYQLLYSFPEKEDNEDARLYRPYNLTVSDSGVLISDFGNPSIRIFTHDGKFLKSIGSYGNNKGQLARPKGIAVDRDSIIYVVDAAFENVQMFNFKGQLLMPFGGAYKGPGYLYLPTDIIVDYEHLKYFQKYVDNRFELKYLILVANQFGQDKISVYGRVELKTVK